MSESSDTRARSPKVEDTEPDLEDHDADNAEDAADEADPEGSEDSEDDDDQQPGRSEETDTLWAEARIDPIKIALPGGKVGYTLRAYRPAGELTPTDLPSLDEEEDPFAERERTRAEEDAALERALEEAVAESVVEVDHDSDDDSPDRPAGDEEPDPEDFLDEDEDEAAGTEDGAEQEAPEEDDTPALLSHQGRLLLFTTPEALVTFIGSDADHDLAQLDTWETLVERVRPEDIVAADEDSYELDLIVENLRGGHDAWDLRLLAAAGEFARDVGWALRLEPVITALAPGSPLDDLDDAVRAADRGGLGGLFARRRLRRIGAQQASLGWRTVIGKISSVVDWRD